MGAGGERKRKKNRKLILGLEENSMGHQSLFGRFKGPGSNPGF